MGHQFRIEELRRHWLGCGASRQNMVPQREPLIEALVKSNSVFDSLFCRRTPYLPSHNNHCGWLLWRQPKNAHWSVIHFKSPNLKQMTGKQCERVASDTELCRHRESRWVTFGHIYPWQFYTPHQHNTIIMKEIIMSLNQWMTYRECRPSRTAQSYHGTRSAPIHSIFKSRKKTFWLPADNQSFLLSQVTVQ